MASKALEEAQNIANQSALEEAQSIASAVPDSVMDKYRPSALFPQLKIGKEIMKAGAGTLHDLFGLLTLPYTATLKKPTQFEKELKRGGTALGASIPAGMLGELIGGPVGAGALGSAVYSAAASPGDRPLETATAAVGGGVLGKVLGKFSPRTPVPAEASADIHPTVARLTEAIKAAGPIRERQEAGYSLERGIRFGKAASARAKVGGEAGAQAARSEMGGELPKLKFEEVRGQFNQGEINDLFNIINNSGLTEGEKLSASSGLTKLLGIGGFEVPQRGELAKLNTLFGREFTEAALSKRDLMQKIGSHIGEAINIPRAVMSSFDLSAPGRQGLLMISRPEYWRALAPMVKSFGSENFYKSVMSDIYQRPSYEHMRIGKLALAEMGEAAGVREEAFRSTLAERIPIAGKAIMASERGYTAFLNKVRADVFDSVLKQDAAAGININNPEYLQGLGRWVNTFTGRGNLPKALNEMSGALGTAFFSPRLQAARFNVLNPQFYMNLPPTVRQEAIKTGMFSAGSLVTLLGLASLSPGVKVGTDPRSSDFGKIRLGKTRIDLLAGGQQPIRLMAQLGTDTIVSSTTGREYTPEKHQAEVLGKYLESKTSPIASFLWGMANHENSLGEPFDMSKEIGTRLFPLAWQDTWDAVKEYGPAGYAVAPLTTAGIGVQTYGRTVKPFKYNSQGHSISVTVGPDVLNKFVDDLDNSDQTITQALLSTPGFLDQPKELQQKRLKAMLGRGRTQVERKWLGANAKYIENESVELRDVPK